MEKLNIRKLDSSGRGYVFDYSVSLYCDWSYINKHCPKEEYGLFIEDVIEQRYGSIKYPQNVFIVKKQ